MRSSSHVMYAIWSILKIVETNYFHWIRRIVCETFLPETFLSKLANNSACINVVLVSDSTVMSITNVIMR